MRVLKSLCRFKMCTDVKDSLGVKFPFPVLTRDWNKLLLFSGPLNSSTFAQSKQICSFDDGDTHTRSIDLVGVESAHSAIQVKDWQMKPETPNVSHATPHFWRKMQMKTYLARQVDLSRLRPFQRHSFPRPHHCKKIQQKQEISNGFKNKPGERLKAILAWKSATSHLWKFSDRMSRTLLHRSSIALAAVSKRSAPGKKSL